MPHSSCAPPVPTPALPTASSPVPMTSGKISTCKSPVTTKSSGPSLLPAIPTSSSPMTAVAKLRAPLSSSTSPPRPLPPAPPLSTLFLPRAIPSPSTSTSTTSADSCQTIDCIISQLYSHAQFMNDLGNVSPLKLFLDFP